MHWKKPGTCWVNAIMATIEPARAQKGNFFSQDEVRQLCRSVLHVSQDPVVGNGQRATTFWERITKHYQENRPGGCAERPSRSLETKWGVIKHDVSKFCGVYKSILLLRESGTSAEDVLDHALDLYKVRHPKQQPFVFVHCWRLLKDVPRWADVVCSAAMPQTSVRSPTGMPKRRTVAQPPSSAAEVEAEAETGVADVDEVGDEALPKRPKRSQGLKSAKDELRLRHVKEVAIHAQGRATADLAAANMRKAQVLQDQAALSLFTMLLEQGLSDEAREYLSLRRQEEMSKLRQCLAEEKRDEARVAADASRLEQQRSAELHRATRNRVHPAPLQPPPRTGIATTSPGAHSPFTSPGASVNLGFRVPHLNAPAR